MDAGGYPEFEQDASDRLDYHVDFEEHLAKVYERDKTYTTGDMVRPVPATGFQYEATTGGRTGSKPVRWPTTLAATVVDGSVTWTCRALATTSLKTTVSGTPTWAADSGLTVSGETISGQRTSAYISGGTAGQRYLVRVEATMADSTKRNALFWLTIRERRVTV